MNVHDFHAKSVKSLLGGKKLLIICYSIKKKLPQSKIQFFNTEFSSKI